jgi:uncharacterized protein (TIRG00374 family)
MYMHHLLSRALLLVVGTALGIVLLVLLLRSVNPGALGNAMGDADHTLLAISLLPWLVNWLLKVPRWALLFGEGSPDWDTLFGGLNVGYAINTLLPARLGELVRAYWVQDRSGVGMVHALSTIAVERVMDGMTLILFLLIVLPSVNLPRQLAGPALTIGAAFFVLLLAMAVVVYGSARKPDLVERMFLAAERGRAAPLGRAGRQIMSGLQVLRSPRSLLLLIAYQLIIWGSNVVLAALLLAAFHISVPLSAAALLVAVLNLGMAVPSSPGYVGVFEYLVVLTLALYHVARAPALAFAPITVVGVIYIARALGSTVQLLRMSVNRGEST